MEWELGDEKAEKGKDVGNSQKRKQNRQMLGP